mmetsp:Transcript_24180/g.78819  ORF Transcript_24180/g.78819 Transcript_24180/m.78819 type:complete len:90 (+) Transcript_24180:1566-1835(+)
MNGNPIFVQRFAFDLVDSKIFLSMSVLYRFSSDDCLKPIGADGDCSDGESSDESAFDDLRIRGMTVAMMNQCRYAVAVLMDSTYPNGER